MFRFSWCKSIILINSQISWDLTNRIIAWSNIPVFLNFVTRNAWLLFIRIETCDMTKFGVGRLIFVCLCQCQRFWLLLRSPNVNSSDCFFLQTHCQQFRLLPLIVPLSAVLTASSYSPNVNSSDCFLPLSHCQQFWLFPPTAPMSAVPTASSHCPNVSSSDCFLL